jgi:hypothetical protein
MIAGMILSTAVTDQAQSWLAGGRQIDQRLLAIATKFHGKEK